MDHITLRWYKIHKIGHNRVIPIFIIRNLNYLKLHILYISRFFFFFLRPTHISYVPWNPYTNNVKFSRFQHISPNEVFPYHIRFILGPYFFPPFLFYMFRHIPFLRTSLSTLFSWHLRNHFVPTFSRVQIERLRR